jgi:hypothetical protein
MSLVAYSGLSRILVLGSLIAGLLMPWPAVIRDTIPRVFSVFRGADKYGYLEDFRMLDPHRLQSAEAAPAFPYINCWKYINENTALESKVGILTSFTSRADGYYLERDFYYLNPSEQVQYDFTHLADPSQIRQALSLLGISHVVLDSGVLRQFSPASDWSTYRGFDPLSNGVYALDYFCRNSCKFLYANERYSLFEL